MSGPMEVAYTIGRYVAQARDAIREENPREAVRCHQVALQGISRLGAHVSVGIASAVDELWRDIEERFGAARIAEVQVSDGEATSSLDAAIEEVSS